MKILHILATPRAEGTPNLVLDWLATGEHEQEVFVLHSEPADLAASLREAASWYVETNYFARGKRKFTDMILGVREVCLERKPDLVVCWITGFANWVFLGARLAGVKNLLAYGGNPPKRCFKDDLMTKFVLWPTAILGGKVLCCSDYVRDGYRAVPGIPDHLLETVWNCTRADEVMRRADLARSERRSDNAGATALMVATLEPHKDHETLFRAVPLIRAEHRDFRLLLAGDGSLGPTLEQRVTELGISEAVEFLGMRRDVPELLGSADLFVFSTTDQEGLGSVLLEAMAAGLPIIASDVPACREVLQDGAHGELVKPADPAALAAAIISFFRHPGDEVALARSREFALSFTARRMMDHYLSHVEVHRDS
jgi:glycosyltransferase involved in cell wall biosynthesis